MLEGKVNSEGSLMSAPAPPSCRSQSQIQQRTHYSQQTVYPYNYLRTRH